jgi:hypothetical protein
MVQREDFPKENPGATHDRHATAGEKYSRLPYAQQLLPLSRRQPDPWNKSREYD